MFFSLARSFKFDSISLMIFHIAKRETKLTRGIIRVVSTLFINCLNLYGTRAEDVLCNV